MKSWTYLAVKHPRMLKINDHEMPRKRKFSNSLLPLRMQYPSFASDFVLDLCIYLYVYAKFGEDGRTINCFYR